MWETFINLIKIVFFKPAKISPKVKKENFPFWSCGQNAAIWLVKHDLWRHHQKSINRREILRWWEGSDQTKVSCCKELPKNPVLSQKQIQSLKTDLAKQAWNPRADEMIMIRGLNSRFGLAKTSQNVHLYNIKLKQKFQKPQKLANWRQKLWKP